MSKFVLTRYLYIFDEVAISFITCLLKKKSLQECYYWLSELYYSGYIEQTWNLLWFVYYDFYYLGNQMFQIFINKKYVIYDLKSMMTIVKNLFRMEATSNIFITRQYHLHIKEIGHIFRGKKPAWIIDYPLRYQPLFRYINKKNYHYAVSCLPDNIDDELYDSIKIYFKLTEDEINSSKKHVNESQYFNKIHILWAIICSHIFPEYQINNQKKNTIYISCSDSEYNDIVHHNEEPIPLSKSGNSQIYNTLQIKRKYAIYTNCGGFHLMRDTFNDDNNINNIDIMKRIIWYQWEYYAYDCPLWKERFNMYDIIIDSDKNKITFHDDDELEIFYSQFGYYPDEQSSETMNKSIALNIHDNYTTGNTYVGNWTNWYNDIFTQKPIFDFDDDFKFQY
jgi:hypothetical protein